MSRYNHSLSIALVSLLLLTLAPPTQAADDWPMWRYDATRSAASPHELPSKLLLHYTIAGTQRTPVWDDPLNQDLMPYDQIFEPIVADGLLLVAHNDRDKLVAHKLTSGKEQWTFYADAPIRFAPVAHAGCVYVASDDGHLYCLDSKTGSEQWRFSGAPSARKALGNQRITSAWPARGGPVVRDDTVYFAASIWPFMGTFIYALDTATGEVQWCNDSTSADYIKQPHNAPSFAGVAPQGALVATADRLIVPGGRSPPAVLNRADGQQNYFKFGGKGVGGSLVLADENSFYVHTRNRGVLAHDLKTGKTDKWHGNEPVLHDGWVYSADKDEAIEAFDGQHKRVWKLDEVDASGDSVKAGNRLYAAGSGKLTAIELQADLKKVPTIAWQQPITGDVRRLLAANGHLIAVTLEGDIHIYGEAKQEPADRPKEAFEPPTIGEESLQLARTLMQQTSAPSGYALIYGLDNAPLAEALVQESEYQIAVIDSDRAAVREIRQKWDAAGWYGSRLTAHVGTPQSFQAPPHIAHLVVLDPKTAQLGAMLPEAYGSVRPYGGVLWLPTASEQVANELLATLVTSLSEEQPKFETSTAGAMALRHGALPGAGTWTHQYGNASNTLMSGDSRVATPLGILWFGGSSNLDVLPRHGHGPPEQVIGGRLIIEGMNSLSARDVYTGRIIWKREFEDLDTNGVYYDGSYRDTPLSTAYNQKHIFGANARGTNYVATSDAVYLAIDDHCLVLDPATGETVRKITLPPGDHAEQKWGYVGVMGDVLLAGAGFANYGELVGDSNSRNSFILDMSASRGLIGFDRHTGEQLWSVDAEHSFIHNGICSGGERVYLLDRLPTSVEERLRRRGKEKPDDYRIVAVDLASGKVQWEHAQAIFGSWLSYSAEHDLLLQAGARAKDRSPDEVGEGLAVFQAADGKLVWEKPDLRYSGPCILHHDTIITGTDSYRESAGAFSLLDGAERTITNPITGIEEPWRVTRAYGCNYPIASENLLTFRSGAAGFYDLTGHSGSGNFGGFKSGCTSNLVAAGGVLNAPDYTRTCSCSYQNQTSLALVHMPDLELWTNSKLNSPAGERVQQVGVNLGAPGDRRAANGILWLEYPTVGGDSPDVDFEVSGDSLEYFRRHASQVTTTHSHDHDWVAASGVEGIERLTLKVADDDTQQASYKVRLFFTEPQRTAAAGERVFHVELQGERVRSDVDVLRTTGQPLQAMVIEAQVQLTDLLEVELTASEGSKLPPVLSGVSVERIEAD